MTGDAISTWLRPLRPVLVPARQFDWSWLEMLQDLLDDLLGRHPIGADLPAGTERSNRLRMIRREIARCDHLDTADQPPMLGLFAQFVCGYRDIDLRDTVGLGHGRLIAHHAPQTARERWIPRLVAGELAGVAITEPHGGSRPAETRTHAVVGPGETWLVTGRKTWISRLTEAAVFVVFFRDPTGRLAAAAIDATEPRLHRQPIAPAGLAGWAWGILDLNSVPVKPKEDVLLGDGMALLREHFAAYRPLVTATALGGAAAVFDTVTTVLSGRQANGDLLRLRDSALITLGHAHAQLITSLLGAAMAAQLACAGFRGAESWSCAMKAHGIDTAYRAVAELAPLIGAAGYRAESPIAKTHRDLGGLLYADGIHDSLYLSAGKHHAAFAYRRLPQPAKEQLPPQPTCQATRRPCSHSAVTPCSTASSPTAIRSASNGFTRARDSDTV